jgi:hypothetical protein
MFLGNILWVDGKYLCGLLKKKSWLGSQLFIVDVINIGHRG